MNLKGLIRLLKTSPVLVPVLAAINALLWLTDRLAVLTAARRPVTPQTLLVIRLDALGDYVLFRQYLQLLKTAPPFGGHTLTLLGNVAFRSLAERFDADVVDRFIWVDIYRLSTRLAYRFRVVRKLRQLGVSAVFCPTVSRVLVLDDFLAAATGAPVRIGCQTDFVNLKRWEAWLGDRLYTRLLPRSRGLVFEGERNRRLMEALTGQPVEARRSRLRVEKAAPVELPEQVVVLSLGAGQSFRIWPMARFAAVVAELARRFPACRVVLTGTADERPYARHLLALLPPALAAAVLDGCGRFTLPELIGVLHKARLLLTNETGMVHLAAACGTPTVVVSQGKSLVRWHPYPAGLADQVVYLYPGYIEENRHRLPDIAPEFNPESRFLTEDISVERVMQAVAARLGSA